MCHKCESGTLTVDELLTIARSEKPHVKYTRNIRGDAIAAWKGERWCMVAGLCIDGRWATIGDVCVNGEPLNRQEDWQ